MFFTPRMCIARRRKSLIKCQILHAYMMNKSSSLWSDTQPKPRFLYSRLQKSVKVASLSSVKCRWKKGLTQKSGYGREMFGRTLFGFLWFVFLDHTYFELFLFESICMLDYFIIILHICYPVTAFLELTGHHSRDQIHFIGGFHKGWVKLGRDAGESLCRKE